jgi:prolyl-tRNA synthetase
LSSANETFFSTAGGAVEILYCPSCGAVARTDLAAFRKFAQPTEAPLPIEKVPTPDCSTIDALSAYLQIPREKAAKALMFTRPADGRFVFVVVRGDMALSEAKLRREVGEVRLAAEEEIRAAGAVPGYASPVGLQGALIAVDELIPVSPNLAAGANEPGFHLLNTNCGRDYVPDIIADLVLAGAGSPCAACSTPLELHNADLLGSQGTVDPKAVLMALAEMNHDDRGLNLPAAAAPFDVYMMNLPGKEMDTHGAAEKVYEGLRASGLAVLFDDRDERAGVKFNDADLIGCPIRVTVGEKGLREGRVEMKERKGKDSVMIPLDSISKTIQHSLEHKNGS